MPTDPNRIQSVFLAAVERPADERAAFLDQECGDDAELRQRVDALLAAHDASGDFLGTPPSGPTQQTADSLGPQGLLGARVGPYKLLQLLGEGGMGAVYLAEQEQPVRRRVALKIIKAGMDSDRVIARFEQERQALAVMDHPNIAKVFDAGAGPSDAAGGLAGRPYFVMELVKGIPITEFCDREHLTPKERLELFVPVCQAVQHAHQKGIIHRDLKPGNVLIALYDGRPVPKVIDFGIAKATAQKLTELTMFTEVGQIVGTLEYMAPEQAELNNLDIDTRADIYSLGVILYELLAGSPPFTKKQLRGAAFDEMLRIIREVEPPKPSTRLSSSEELPSIAANRHLEPAKLRRLVHGDLDWIAMKCLAKERGRRYETANGLAMDIQRYLADETVHAGPPSARYRLRKFLRRNKGPVLTVALVLLTLVGGIIGTAIGLVGAEAARRDAVAAQFAEADRAEGERRANEELKRRIVQIQKSNEILASVFHDLDPKSEEKTGKPLRALLGERMDQAVRQLEGEAVGDPLNVNRIQKELAKSLLGLGYPEKAIPVFAKELEANTKLLGPDHHDTLFSKKNLGAAFQDAGRLPEAIKMYEEVLPVLKAKLGPGDRNTLILVNNLANAYQMAGRLPEAIKLYEEVLAVRIAKLAADDPDVLTSQNNLAAAYQACDRLPEAIKLFEVVLAAEKVKSGADHFVTLVTMSNLATVYRKAGRVADAIRQLEEAVPGFQAKLGPNHPSTITSMLNLSMAYQDAGRLPEAIRILEQVVPAFKARLGADHPNTLRSINNLAVAYRNADRVPDAIRLLEEMLPISRAKLGADHPDTAVFLGNLAATYLKSDQPAKAAPILREELAILEKKQPDDWSTFDTRSLLGDALRAQKEYRDAEPLLLTGYEGMKTREAKIPAQSRGRLTQALGRLVHLYDEWNKKNEAAKWRKELEAAQRDAKMKP
jgi:serine/threonine protein kinase/tetratricopeptide (TPR) repeat protein